MNSRTAKKTKVTPATAPSRRRCDGEGMEKTIWLGPDARSVYCVICFKPFESQVFMCKNGHASCARCCVRINRKCWCCEEPIGDVRCRAMEHVLDEMNNVCKFCKYDCREVIKFIDKRYHEEMCPLAPFVCPVGGCSYRGLLLYRNVLDDHSDAATSIAYLEATTVTLRKGEPFRVLVQAGMGSVFLLLNGGGVLTRRSLSLVCLDPCPEGNVQINYKMEVCGSEPGSLSLARTALCIRLLEGYEAKQFLFVPDAEWGPSSSVSVSILIA